MGLVIAPLFYKIYLKKLLTKYLFYSILNIEIKERK